MLGAIHSTQLPPLQPSLQNIEIKNAYYPFGQHAQAVEKVTMEKNEGASPGAKEGGTVQLRRRDCSTFEINPSDALWRQLALHMGAINMIKVVLDSFLMDFFNKLTRAIQNRQHASKFLLTNRLILCRISEPCDKS